MAKAHEWVMGRDQRGTDYHDLGPHPRKALMERLNSKHAKKMYMEYRDGSSQHVGYVIRGFWVHLYKVREWHGRTP